MKPVFKTLIFSMVLLCASCAEQERPTLSGLYASDFQVETADVALDLYTIRNANGMEVCVTPFGARVVSIMVPDREGVMRDVVLGFDNIRDYMTIPSDFGATIGRYGNRIANGRFTLDGKEYQLSQNNFGHCLHGGVEGWQNKPFEVVECADNAMTLRIVSPDGESGFPANVTAEVTYTLDEENALRIDYKANSDALTILNLTNHSYFNLSGDGSKSILDHELQITSSSFTPVDATFMTTGEILSVEGTPMDFRQAKRIGDDIDRYDYEQLKNGNGYDHNWVLDTERDLARRAALLYSPESGIEMEVYTQEPGVQVYTGNFLDGSFAGKHDVVYNQRAAICLETQKYPDTPNKPHWISCELRPDETYATTTIYRFGVRK